MCVRLISLIAWTVCKLFFSKITQPFRQKSHECALKLTDLWKTSLQLFDLNYKFELVGASLLALAKSIHQINYCLSGKVWREKCLPSSDFSCTLLVSTTALNPMN